MFVFQIPRWRQLLCVLRHAGEFGLASEHPPWLHIRKCFSCSWLSLVAVDLSLPGISALDILAFMEYLAHSDMSPDHSTNHLTAIRSMCIVYDCNTIPFRNQWIPLFFTILSFTLRFPILIDETLLLQIIIVSAQLQYPLVYKAVYLVAFFLFSEAFKHIATFDY